MIGIENFSIVNDESPPLEQSVWWSTTAFKEYELLFI